MVIREAGFYAQAVEHLNKFESNIVDKLAVEEFRAELYFKLNLLDKSKEIYLNLIERNPDNLLYYKQLELCKNLSM